jgi:hypothetical protein
MSGTPTTSVTVAANATMALNGSLYKDIRIGKNATVTFTQPVLNISTLKMDEGATLKFTKCTKVHIKCSFEVCKNIIINPDELGVVFYIDNSVNFYEGSHVVGVFFVRSGGCSNGTICFGESKVTKPGFYKGEFLAYSINVQRYNNFYLNENCGNCSVIIPKDLTVTQEEVTDPTTVLQNEPVIRNYPNPFKDKTTVLFILPEDNHVTFEVYDMSGKRVQTLFNDQAMKDREYTVEFDGTELPSGLYMYRMTTSNDVFTGKMILIKE